MLWEIDKIKDCSVDRIREQAIARTLGSGTSQTEARLLLEQLLKVKPGS